MGFLSNLLGSKDKAAPPPIPHNSITMTAPQAPVSQLAVSAFGNVAGYLKKKYGWAAFSISKVEIVAADPDLMIDGLGCIHKGVVSERWHISGGGKNIALMMTFGSDGSGGSLVGIAE